MDTENQSSGQEEIVVQRDFSHVRDFMPYVTDFVNFFMPNTSLGKTYRELPVFSRFQQRFPDLELEVSSAVMSAYSNLCTEWSMVELPSDKLFSAYSLMRNLVSVSDPCAFAEGKPDENYLLKRIIPLYTLQKGLPQTGN